MLNTTITYLEPTDKLKIDIRKKAINTAVAVDSEYVSNIGENRVIIGHSYRDMNSELCGWLEHPTYLAGLAPTWDGNFMLTSLIPGATIDYWSLNDSFYGLPKLNIDIWHIVAEADIVGMFRSYEQQYWLSERLGRPYNMLTPVNLDGTPTKGRLPVPLIVKIDGVNYQLHIGIIDVCKWAGNKGNFEKLLMLSNIPTEDKKLMDEYKNCMNIPYAEQTESFIRYAINDVKHFPDIVKARIFRDDNEHQEQSSRGFWSLLGPAQ
jgi:hypothetical protein